MKDDEDREYRPALRPNIRPVGFDPMAQGSARSVWWVPSFKAPEGCDPLQVATSFNEFLAVLEFEFDPRYRIYCRGDLSESAAIANRLGAIFGTPFWLPYEFDGELHAYMPDYLGFLTDRRQFGCEAGDAGAKSLPQAKAALRSGVSWAKAVGGEFLFASRSSLSKRRLLTGLHFHLARFSYRGPADLVDEVRAILREGPTTLRKLEAEYRKDRREAAHNAALKVLGEFQAAGRLDLPLAKKIFDLDTLIRIRPAR